MTNDLSIFGLWLGFNDIISYALMWAFCVVVFHVLVDNVPQIRFTED